MSLKDSLVILLKSGAGKDLISAAAWNRPLTKKEIEELYNNGYGTSFNGITICTLCGCKIENEEHFELHKSVDLV